MTREQIRQWTRRMDPETARYWRAVLGLREGYLEVRPLQDGVWICYSTMSGRSAVYIVSHKDGFGFSCTCPDYAFNALECKHIHAVRLVKSPTPDA